MVPTSKAEYPIRNVRRYFRKGDICFLTLVTHERRPLLLEHAEKLWSSLKEMKDDSPFDLIAWVLMPDHFHILLDPKNNDVSTLVKRIKLKFAAKYRSALRLDSGRVWQNRYWDHIIRNQEDMNRHIDYIHYNPVKHGLAVDPMAYSESSFRKYVDGGFYSHDWGIIDDPTEGAEIGE